MVQTASETSDLGQLTFIYFFPGSRLLTQYLVSFLHSKECVLSRVAKFKLSEMEPLKVPQSSG